MTSWGGLKIEKHDLIIVGGGPAGLTSAVYAARYAIDTIVIAREAGGLASTAHKICNFPSYSEISGPELMTKMTEQASKLGVPILFEDVVSIRRAGDKSIFEVSTDSGKKFLSKKILLAAGTVHRKLGCPGEEKYIGRGVSYCATCDGAFFKGKTVAVIGGGDSALTSALLLSEYAKKVYIIYRKESFSRAERTWVEAIEKNSRIEPLFSEEVGEITGDKSVTGVMLKSGRQLDLNGVFVEIGSVPNTAMLEEIDVELTDNYLKTDGSQESSVRGLYAAGDITTNSNRFKQVITAAAEGAVAVNAIFKELQQ